MKNSKKNKKVMPDQLMIENVIRRRHSQDWPTVIYQMMGRVRGVNQAWQHIMNAIMKAEGLRVIYAREGDDLVITVTYNGEVEQHTLTADEVSAAAAYMEVVVASRLRNSSLLIRASTGK